MPVMTRKSGSGKRDQEQSLLRALLSAILFSACALVILSLPDYPAGLSGPWFLRLPLEVPLAALALLLLPQKTAKPLAVLVSLLLLALLLLKLADLGVQAAFQRPFNLYLDVTLMKNGWLFLSATFGLFKIALALMLALSACAGVAFLIWRTQSGLIRARGRQRTILLAGFAIATAMIGGLALLPPQSQLPVTGTLQAAQGIGKRVAGIVQSARDLQAFEAELSGAPSLPNPGLFEAIKGRDVVLVFIESYGRSAIENPGFRPLIAPRLENIEQSLTDAGFSSASLWSGSPTVAGLSWLAHGTLLSGLWVDNQARYDRLMASQWPSLNRLFSGAGWRTSAIMPAITMDWPEQTYFGYDQTLQAKDLDYQGKPYNWVTMPDQYTLTAFDRLSRNVEDPQNRPLMAEIALISSHAPWTPVARLIDWKDVGDGTIFNNQATSGETPEAVWSDQKKIQNHYIRTINYSLETLGSYVSHFGENAVFVILGDHQPADIVTGPDATQDVPVHVISKDKALIRRLEDRGFTSGMLPNSETGQIRMDRLRETLIEAFSASPSPAEK